jgi:hypothetical protein
LIRLLHPKHVVELFYLRMAVEHFLLELLIVSACMYCCMLRMPAEFPSTWTELHSVESLLKNYCNSISLNLHALMHSADSKIFGWFQSVKASVANWQKFRFQNTKVATQNNANEFSSDLIIKESKSGRAFLEFTVVFHVVNLDFYIKIISYIQSFTLFFSPFISEKLFF